MDDFAVLVSRYGLAAIFLFTFLENVGLPIPAFPVLMLAGAYASTMHTAVPLVVGVAVAAALLAAGGGGSGCSITFAVFRSTRTRAWSGPWTGSTGGRAPPSCSRSSSPA